MKRYVEDEMHLQNRCQVNLHLREESARREEALEREVWIHMNRASRFYFGGKIDKTRFS